MNDAAKSELRQRLLARRRATPSDALARVSLALSDALVAAPVWQQARGIAAFVGVRREVDTVPLLERTLAAGKQLWLPRVLGGGELGFWSCAELDELERGKMALREPPMRGEPCTVLSPAHGIDLILVPGLAFDLGGARIGFGAGHYDRSLARALAAVGEQAPRVGVCPAEFIEALGTIPLAEHDVSMTHVLSERGLQLCTEQR